jgi:hypothetical protein
VEETGGWITAGIAGASLTISAVSVFIAKQAMTISKENLAWNKKKGKKAMGVSKRAKAYAEWKDERDSPHKRR